MKRVIFSDLHLHPWSYGANSISRPNGWNSRIYAQWLALRDLLIYVKINNIKHIYFGGDWFHVPGNIPAQAATITKWFFTCLNQNPEIKIRLLVGNHDMSNRDGAIHSQVFTKTDNVTLPGRITHYNDNGVEVFTLGYTKDSNTIKHFLDYANDQGGGMLLMHQGVKNVPLASGWVIDEALTPNMIPENCRAFTGHYHYHQAVTPNLTVIGNLTAHNWNDIDQHKGFLVWDDETNELEFVESKAPRFVSFNFEEDHLSKVEGNFVKYSKQTNDMDDVRDALLNAGALTVEFPFSKIDLKTSSTNFTKEFNVDDYLNKLEQNMDSRRIEVGRELREATYAVN